MGAVPFYEAKMGSGGKTGYVADLDEQPGRTGRTDAVLVHQCCAGRGDECLEVLYRHCRSGRTSRFSDVLIRRGKRVRVNCVSANSVNSGVILITGVMAAGKSTVAQRLAESMPQGVHVRGDVFRRMIVSGREELMPDQTAEALAAGFALPPVRHGRGRIRRGGFCAVVQDVILGKDLETFVGLITTRPLYVIVLQPARDVVAQREQERGKTGYGTWTIEALDDSLRRDTPRIGLWIDNSAQTPDDTVAQIIGNLPAAAIS
jgi:chloramphenicol 3-O-phosphotransferase